MIIIVKETNNWIYADIPQITVSIIGKIITWRIEDSLELPKCQIIASPCKHTAGLAECLRLDLVTVESHGNIF